MKNKQDSVPVYRAISDTNLSDEKFNQILCPNLRIGVRMGLLNPDQHGWVKSGELRNFLKYIGAEPKSYIVDTLISLGESTTKVKKDDHINITQFKGSDLDHGSSSGVLNSPQGFSAERLEYLKSFASDEKCMHYRNFAVAANNFHNKAVNFKSIKGTLIQSLEFSILLELYGRKDKSSGVYFELDDIDNIWKENRFPLTWQPPKKNFYGTARVLLKFAFMSMARIWHSWFK